MSRRSLWPREHGAYAQLLVPLATALILRTPVLAAALLAVAACAAFAAHEPLLVVLGHRGRRRRDTDGARAARWLAAAIAIAAGAGIAGLVLANSDARALAAVAVVVALAMIALAWTRSEHSLVGELVAAIALPGAAAPVAAASGAGAHRAAVLWAGWAIGFGCTVVAVHRVIARHRSRASSADRVIAAALAAVAIGALVAIPIAAPLALAALVLTLRPPSATRLRAIGFVLVAASVASAVVALA